MALEANGDFNLSKLGGVNAGFRKVSAASLEGQHHDIFVRAVSNVLSTEIAEFTYAQIIDGLPLSSIADDTYDNGGSLTHTHPLYTKHTKLCPGVLETTRQFRAGFDPSIMQFDYRLFHAYQAASPGSRSFKTRLIEMVAVAVHQVAVQLVKLDTSLHKNDGIASWVPPEDDTIFWTFFPEGPPPTLFRHGWYGDYEQYPDDVADMVGYWAEARILGGVVLFNRRSSGAHSESDAIFFHSDRNEVTYRIYQLLDSQKQQLLEFFLSVTPTSCPLPILGDENNIRRVDPEEPIEITGIYRNRWERKPLPPDAPDIRRKDVYDSLNYPTMKDFLQAQERAYRREDAKYE